MKSLRIQNFQAHADLEIDFDPRITTIIGPSDAGKSSVLRALKWLIMNEPRGAGFIRNGTKKTTVTLEVENGMTITRTRGGDLNLYQLNDESYKAFGNEVPIDIQNFLNVNHLNFQGQHDPPFWFTATAGEVSRQLNQIVDLGTIDSTLAAIDSIARKTRTEVEILKERRRDIKQKGRKLKWTKKAHQDLEAVETLKIAWEEETTKSSRLNELVYQVKRYQNTIESMTQANSSGDIALKSGKAWEKQFKNRQRLENIIEAIVALEKKASQPFPPSLTPIERLAERAKKISKQRSTLAEIIDNLVEGQEILCQKENRLQSLEEKFQEEMGDQCPLCENVIKS